MNTAEAIIRLLEGYEVDTVFGIPGVHTLELYRGLGNSSIRHIQPRNEMGGGFMADGYARAGGRPGVCLVITGPGLTNMTTPMGQAFADSVPMLVISSSPPSETLGKGWGMLHEISDQAAVTAPITAFSATITAPEQIPDLIGRAFAGFATERPRPVHLTVPLDILAMDAGDGWGVSQPPEPPQPDAAAVSAAAELLAEAEAPLLVIGSGARGAGSDLRAIAESLQATVVTSNGGKGIVPDDHPLNLGATMTRPPVQQLIAAADVVLAVGTEIGHTDHFTGAKLDLTGKLIRVDIDPRKIDDLYEAAIGIVGDARLITAQLASALADRPRRTSRHAEVNETRSLAFSNLSSRERQHLRLLGVLREAAPDDTVVCADMTQLAYSGSWGFPVFGERQWLYPAGFCTLGPALPGAIGAKLAVPDRPVMALAGDGGFMFTVQELVTGAELELPLPIILWNNSGYQQIRGDMQRKGIATIGVNGRNPDFMTLAAAMHCHGVRPGDAVELEKAVVAAFAADRPTIIEVLEGSPWLVD